MPGPRIAVVGGGVFGRNHLRVIHNSEHACRGSDIDAARAAEAAKPYDCLTFQSLEDLAKNADAAVVATPTLTHSEIGCRLMELGLDILVEKPIAQDPVSGRAPGRNLAARTGRDPASGAFGTI